MDFKKIFLALSTSPFVTNIVTHYAPYFPYISAVTWAVVGDCLFGLLANTKEKYGSLHIAFVLKSFRSRKLLSKFGIGLLFFLGLFFIDRSDLLIQKLGVGKQEAGIWWCVAYGLYEVTSILENLGRLDFPVARQVKNWINSKVPPELQNVEKTKAEEKNG